MPNVQTKEAASVSINIRAKAKQRDLIDQAASRLGRSQDDAAQHAQPVAGLAAGSARRR